MRRDVQALSGRGLLWAYVLALGTVPEIMADGRVRFRAAGSQLQEPQWLYPFLSRAAAADLIAEHWISVDRPSAGQTPPIFQCVADYKGPVPGGIRPFVAAGSSVDFAEAVFRCFVASRLGAVVEVPDEALAPVAGEPAPTEDCYGAVATGAEDVRVEVGADATGNAQSTTREMLVRARNLLSQPPHWAAHPKGVASRYRLSSEIAAHLKRSSAAAGEGGELGC